jgi:tryptophan synthase alpha chain
MAVTPRQSQPETVERNPETTTPFEQIFARARSERRCALIPFITAGDPSLSATLEIATALSREGADIIELGIPFSDPLADGPVIQQASERALRNRVTAGDVIAIAAEIRRRSAVGLVLFGYVNPVLRYGLERFARDAAMAGVDGLLATDLIPEEADEYRRTLATHSLAPIFLAAPTSPEPRLRMIAEASRGFVYAVSRTGVTGAREHVPAGARELVASIRRFTRLPVALGFGISTAAQVAEVATFADGAAVGTALVNAIDEGTRQGGEKGAVEAAASFLRSLTLTK